MKNIGWGDVYGAFGAVFEKGTEKPAQTATPSAVQQVTKGVNNDGSTLVNRQATNQPNYLLWGGIGLGVLVVLVLIILMVRK